jgi:hypothetical protein
LGQPLDLAGRQSLVPDGELIDQPAVAPVAVVLDAADEEAADRGQVGGIGVGVEELAVLVDPLAVAVLDEGVVVPLSLPLAGVAFRLRDALRAVAAARGVPVDHAVAPGDVRVEGAGARAVGVA